MEAFIIVFMFAGIVAVIVGAALLRGWVLSILWGWFIVPIFHLPQLGVAQAMALSLTLSLLTHQYVPSKKDDQWGPVTFCVLFPLVALLIGWILKGYV